jgi:hypothetical protein
MDLKFTRTTPVETNRGRKAEDNPFEEVIQEIAHKTDEQGKPLALSTVLTVPKPEEGETQADVNKRLMSSIITKLKNAGLKVTPEAVTVNRNFDFAPDNKTVKLTFWTSNKIVRTAKKKDEQTTPVAE